MAEAHVGGTWTLNDEDEPSALLLRRSLLRLRLIMRRSSLASLLSPTLCRCFRKFMRSADLLGVSALGGQCDGLIWVGDTVPGKQVQTKPAEPAIVSFFGVFA